MIRSVRFTLRQLEYFVATCDAGSVTKAAARDPGRTVVRVGRALAARGRPRRRVADAAPRTRRLADPGGPALPDAGTRRAARRGGARALRLRAGGRARGRARARVLPAARTADRRAPLSDVRAGARRGGRRARRGRVRTSSWRGCGADISRWRSPTTSSSTTTSPSRRSPSCRRSRCSRPTIRSPRASRSSLRELADEPLVLLDLPHSRDYFRALFLAEGVDPATRTALDAARGDPHARRERLRLHDHQRAAADRSGARRAPAPHGADRRGAAPDDPRRRRARGLTPDAPRRPRSSTTARAAIAAGEIPGLRHARG